MRNLFEEDSVYQFVGDVLFEQFRDEDFADPYSNDGQPVLSPVLLSFVTIFQSLKDFCDRKTVYGLRFRSLPTKSSLSLLASHFHMPRTLGSTRSTGSMPIGRRCSEKYFVQRSNGGIEPASLTTDHRPLTTDHRKPSLATPALRCRDDPAGHLTMSTLDNDARRSPTADLNPPCERVSGRADALVR